MRALEDPRAAEPLVLALAWETDADRSYGVAAALEETGDPRAVAALVDAALDARRPVPRRAEAAEALAAFPDPRSIETLTRLAKEEGFALASSYGLFRLTGDPVHVEPLKGHIAGGEGGAHALELVARCRHPQVEALLLYAAGVSPDALRDRAVALLRERYPETAPPRLREMFLKEARMSSPPPSALRYLGELGGDEVATALLDLVDRLRGETWEHAARALAQTGDPRAERWFHRARIVEKDSERRRIAEELAPVASKRRAERARAVAGG